MFWILKSPDREQIQSPTIPNDNDSAMSTKSLNETVTIKFVFALPQTLRGQLTYMKHLYKSFVSLFLHYKHSNNHRITGIKRL